MYLRILTVVISVLFFSCKEKIQQPEKIADVETATITENSTTTEKKQITEYHYVAQNNVFLYDGIDLSYKSEKIDTLNFLEPIKIITKRKDLEYSIGGYRELDGYICYIQTLDGTKGFIFSEYLKTYDELSKRFNMKDLDKNSIANNGRLSKAEGMLRLFNSLDDKPSKKYSYTIANRLSLRKNPLLDAKRITVLKYLEPLEIIENLPNKKETIEDKEDGTIHGNWCKVRLLNGTEGYAFNGYIKPFGELSEKLFPKGIEEDELLINGKLKTTTTLDYFLEVIGKPDSIKYYQVVKDDYSDKIERTYIDGILYIIQNTDQHLELGDGGWIYDDLDVHFYYKNGIEYEELNGEVGFSNIDFTQNNNYLEYNGFRIDSTTTLKAITKLFPIQSIHKPWRYDEDDGQFFEFGTIREKNNGTEVFWQLHCSKKATSFNVYWYD